MNAMKNIPFSSFMLREARDCPICMESFRPEDQVVQLKCSKYHIFHSNCFQSYLNAPGVSKKCPLCRQVVQY